MGYKKPTQARAIETEQRFLNALDECLREKSFDATSIVDIAERAGLHRSAFLARFGDKQQALLVLFERYCDLVSDVVETIRLKIDVYESLDAMCYEMSTQLEQIQTSHFGANRAMQEYFYQKLETHDLVKRIFLDTVGLIKSAQHKFLDESQRTDEGAFAATQLLVTLNFNYVMRGMPGLPKASEDRHALISKCMCAALTS
jgi:AcrR family transcriptional regulator